MSVQAGLLVMFEAFWVIKKGVCFGYRWAVVSVLTVICMLTWGYIGVHIGGLLVAVFTQI